MTVFPGARRAISERSHHAVQFYENDAYLHEIVGRFLSEGIMAGQSAVVIATPEHRRAFAERLSVGGMNVEELPIDFLDARETLSKFMVDGLPDSGRFASSVGVVVQRLASRGAVRAYGEMVDLLWRDGQTEAALRLEELWNDLAQQHRFALLCAYSIGNFYRESDAALLERICDVHDSAAPAESFTALSADDGRERQVVLLQQRAAMLEAEIEQREELEKALREALAGRRRAERELKDFLDNATVPLHRVGPDGTILWANEAELELVGYPAEDYIGRNITEFHADAPVIADILQRLSAKEEIRDFEARLRAKDGSIKHVSISSSVLFEDGKFIHTRCFTRDITDRKRLEEQNAFLLEATTILIRTLDYETRLCDLADLVVPRIADWCAVDVAQDDGTFRRIRVAQSEAISSEAAVVLSSRLQPDGAHLAGVMRRGAPSLIVDPFTTAGPSDDAGTVPLPGASMIIVPMKIGDRVLGSMTMVMTGSGRRYSDRDLPTAIELVRRAAVAVENARLYGVAQQANRAKDEFLATLSHELRTPLTAILGWAQLLTLGTLDSEATRTALETIENSARTQATLVDDMLDLSRIVTGKFTLRHELVDAGSVAEGAVQTLGLAARARGIRIDLSVSAGLSISGDATRLQQIIWNLLSNAVKFSKSGDTVSLSVDRAGENARIVVRDSGRGISSEFLPHVFEPFRQADGATTRTHGGLGLGLAIVKYLVELHGGTVSAASEGVGRGATFTVLLPLAS
jgi:PAS domain S-box-containing protein